MSDASTDFSGLKVDQFRAVAHPIATGVQVRSGSATTRPYAHSGELNDRGQWLYYGNVTCRV